MQIVNWRIISHPMNWAIILMMVVIAAMGGHLLLTYFEQEPARSSDEQIPDGLTTEQLGSQFAEGGFGMSSLSGAQP